MTARSSRNVVVNKWILICRNYYLFFRYQWIESCLFFMVLLVIILLFTITIICCHYAKHWSKQKHNNINNAKRENNELNKVWTFWFSQFDNILLDEKWHENKLIYDVSCKTLIGAKPLCIIFHNVDGFNRS